ncbi:MAG: hypothetical protein U0522_01220 [Candidatus Paceibacterota bacterium]
MSTNQFPELEKSEWDLAHESATPSGMKGLTRAMQLMTTGIANTRSQIGTQVGYLTKRIADLNYRLDQFNKSSESLTEKALSLTKCIMVATTISAVATAILAIDIVMHWFH